MRCLNCGDDKAKRWLFDDDDGRKVGKYSEREKSSVVSWSLILNDMLEVKSIGESLNIIMCNRKYIMW